MPDPSSTRSILDDVPPEELLSAAYGRLVETRMHEGWSGSLLTIMFQYIPGSYRLHHMRGETQRIYSRFLTRVARNPRRPGSIDRLPILIGAIDAPANTRRPYSLAEAVGNGGLHVHAILLVPPRSRLQESVVEHFRANERLYSPPSSRIARIHVDAITHDPAYVTDYALKAIKNNRLPYEDAIIVLPRAVSELPDRDSAPHRTAAAFEGH